MKPMPFESVRKVADADFPTRWGHFRILGFEGVVANPESCNANTPAPVKRMEGAVALVMGDIQAKPPIIRIHSQQKWPAAVVFDTAVSTIAPPQTPAVAAAEPAAQPAREAFAMASEAAPAARPADAVKAAKPRVRRARTARAPDGRVANSEPFGFGNDWFAPTRREASAGRNEPFGSRGPWRMGW